ncbi:MAG: DEAD/DEAH box helicase, partial [Oscillospiraceae bacterium]|nr:DEAD/DEAH box helicase [Oscillospiraceae bacterium]
MNSLSRKWFGRAFGAPTSVQELAWPEISSGKNVLASAPTGTGKTLAAFLVFIDALGERARRGGDDGLFLIYVSPLKSLASDIRENLRRPLDGIAALERELGAPEVTAGITVAVRTGDTTAAERRRMAKKPPNILITTPESLYLLLTSDSGRNMLKTARALIIDELHALINTKRGAHLMLSAARLDALCGRPLQRVGLSATVAPLALAAEYLSPDGAVIVAPSSEKKSEMRVISPFPESGFLPEGTIWPEIARVVVDSCAGARTAIAFTENRRAAEKLAYHVNELAGEGFALSHHGSVSKERRQETEERLRGGELRLLVATSSMELGIDVGAIDIVLQIGCPRGISSALQRLGRAGHTPGGLSVMRIIPHTAPEALYCAMTAGVATEGGIETSRPPRLCLDILAQHLASAATAGEFAAEEFLRITVRAYPFRGVTREDIEGVLRMLAGDFEHGRDIPVRPRLIYDRINGTVAGDAYTRLLALSSGGTIPDKGLFTVKTEGGVKLGEVDEEFTFEARVGDRFLLGAFAWRITDTTRDSVIVAPSSPEGAQAPFWKGDWDGRAYETGLRFGEILRGLGAARDIEGELGKLGADADSAERAAGYIQNQLEATGVLPDDRTIIAEHFTDETGIGQLMVHSIFGRRVNAPLALLARAAAGGMTGMDLGEFDDDDGFLLFPYSEGSIPEGVLRAIDLSSAEGALSAMLPETPLFSMAFRYNAARALMMGTRLSGRNPLWVQRMRSAEMLEAVIRVENHPLVRETRRECLEDYWDVGGALRVLRGIRSGEIHVREVYTESPSPFSLPLRRAAEATLMYEYSPTPEGVRTAVSEELGELLPPSAARLEAVSERAAAPASAEELHTRLMIEGEAAAGDIDAPPDWFEKLARAGRVRYVEPGFWIAAEHAEEYENALERGDFEARLTIVRRALRYRGGMGAEDIAERYFWDDNTAANVLAELERLGAAVRSGDIWYHAELYERARRETVRDRRKLAVTQPAERYADLMLRRRTIPAPPAEQAALALRQLRDTELSPEAWEDVVLPARVRGYRAELLEKALGAGEVFWRYGDGRVSFHLYEDEDFDAEIPVPEDLSGYEREILAFLRARGASFARSLPTARAGETQSEALFSLIRRGLVRCDSFAPVRRLGDERPKSEAEMKRLARARSAALTGRFEAARPLRELTVEERIEWIFDSEVVMCRETARGRVDWGAALEKLRLWELTGRARRGYFVEGLGGAQFIRGADAEQTTLALSSAREDIVWISAVDPAQKWGKTLAHREGRAFLAVPGTAVALAGGLPVAVFERRGAALRLFDGADASAVLSSFAREFSLGTVYAGARRVTVREYPEGAAEALRAAG